MQFSRVSAAFAGVALLALTACTTACTTMMDVAIEHVKSEALDSVSQELSKDAGFGKVDLEIRGNPRGEGFVIQPLRHDSASAEQPIAWLSLSGKPYAANEATRALTPTLPLVADAPAEVLDRASIRHPVDADVAAILATNR